MEVLTRPDAAAWEAWLDAHHGERTDVWLRIAKKGSGLPSVGPTEAIEVALCFGWIDSQRKSDDAEHFLQRFSPRRRGSSWSRLNVERAQALAASGRMRPAGLAEVEAAKADGRWEAAYGPQRSATVPPDLAAALARDERARAYFESLGKTQRYAVILRLAKARTAVARQVQLDRVLELLRTGEPIA